MRTRVALVALAAALTLSACGGSTSTSSTDSAPAEDVPTASAAAAAGTFGSPLDLGNGVTITVSEPASFKPGAFASNYIPSQIPDLVTVDVKNGGTSDLDMATLVVAASSAGNSCTDVLDGDNGINGAPTDPLAAGASVSFKIGVACDAKAGDPLEISISVGEASAAISGTLV